MASEKPAPSARQLDLLERAYQHTLKHGFTGLSLRPLASAIGSSPRVLLYLFGSKHGLIRAMLARARTDELAVLQQLRELNDDQPVGLDMATAQLWSWLSAVEHRSLLTLWVEAYSRSLSDPKGPWADFARTTVEDWLAVLTAAQHPQQRTTLRGKHQRTLALAVLRGALLDLLATKDEERTTGAIRIHLAAAELARN